MKKDGPFSRIADLRDFRLTDQKLEASRASLFLAVVIYSVVGYFVTNRVSSPLAIHMPVSTLDSITPFVPWTGWIYVTLYLLPLFPAFIVNRGQDLKEAALGFFAASTFCFFVFVSYPTSCVRPPLEMTGWEALPLELVRQIDHASNAFPSLHVTYSFLSAAYIKRYRPRLSAFLSFWAVVISISTMTTKQHIFADVAAGAMLAAVILYFGKPRQPLMDPTTTASLD